LHAYAVHESHSDRWRPRGDRRGANLLRVLLSGVLVVLTQSEGEDR